MPSVSETKHLANRRESGDALGRMVQLLRLLCGALMGLLRSTARREAEILVLRHQINVLRRKSPSRSALSNVDRLLFVLLFRLLRTTLADSDPAGHSDPLALRRFSSLLALEIETARWPAKDAS